MSSRSSKRDDKLRSQKITIYFIAKDELETFKEIIAKATENRRSYSKQAYVLLRSALDRKDEDG